MKGPTVQAGYIILDLGDRTLHVGGGKWSLDAERALRYDTHDAAQRAIEEALDPERLLTDRLIVIPAYGVPSTRGLMDDSGFARALRTEARRSRS